MKVRSAFNMSSDALMRRTWSKTPVRFGCPSMCTDLTSVASIVCHDSFLSPAEVTQTYRGLCRILHLHSGILPPHPSRLSQGGRAKGD
jgi:hypothetical protein